MAGAEFCGNCGAKLIQNQAVAIPQASTVPMQTQSVAQAPTAAPSPPPVEPAPQPNLAQPAAAQPASASTPLAAPVQTTASAVPIQPNSGFSITSMVLGILSILSSLVWFISIPLGIISLVFGVLGRSKGGRGMAIAGIVTSIIGIILSIIILAAALQYVEENPDAMQQGAINVVRLFSN